MGKVLKYVIGGLVGLAVLAAVGFFFFLSYLTRTADLTPYQHLFATDQPAPAGEVTARFMGVSTLHISDGETDLMVDGFFSRPSLLSVGMGPVEPDEGIIDKALARAGITRLDAIFPVHSHYDHAMDTPMVALKTGADVLGSPTTSWIARGGGVPEDKIITVEAGKPYRYGKFTLRFLPSAHAPVATQGQMKDRLDVPLVPPATVFDYPTGIAWSILISHDGSGTMLIQGSAGYVQNNLQGARVDTVFLGMGGLGALPEDHVEAYWEEMVLKTHATHVYGTHWDDFFRPLPLEEGDDPLMAAGGEINGFEKGMDWLIQKTGQAGVGLNMIRAFDRVPVFP